MEKVKELTFIGVKPLDLDVEDGVWVKGDVVFVLDILGELHLVLMLDVHDSLLDVFIGVEFLELLKLFWMLDPGIADLFGDEVGQFFVAI